MLAIESHTEEPSGALVVRIVGEADLHTTDQLDSTLAALLDTAPESVVFDLSAASFMGSLALGILVQFQKSLAAREGGGHMTLAAVRPNLAACLHFTRLDTVFEIHPTVSDALTSRTR